MESIDPEDATVDSSEPDINGYIHKPRDSDVLCGRGGAALRHPGNKTYRRLVNLNKGLYSTCLKTEKIKISRSIVGAIREQKGRFLEKDTTANVWVDIGDKKAEEKTSQALREGQPKLRQKIAELGVTPITTDSVPGTSAIPPCSSSVTNHLMLQQRQRVVQMQQQQQLYRQEMLRQQVELFQQQRGGSYSDLTGQQINRNNIFLNGSNQSLSSRSGEQVSDLHTPSCLRTSIHPGDSHSDMLQRLTLQDMQAVASSTGEISFEEHQRNFLPHTGINNMGIPMPTKGVGMEQSNLPLFSDHSAYESAQWRHGPSGALGCMMQGTGLGMSDLVTQGVNQSVMSSVGHIGSDHSMNHTDVSNTLMGMPLGSIHTLSSIDNLDASSNSVNTIGISNNNNSNNNIMFKSDQFIDNSQSAVMAAAAAAATAALNTNPSLNNLNFDRRRLFANMKYSRTPSMNRSQGLSSEEMQDIHMMESNTSMYSHTSNMTDSKPAAVRTRDAQLSSAQKMSPSPIKIIVETAKVIDHSKDRSKDNFAQGDVMSSGSRHSIMSGLSRISDNSIDQSIFSDLSKKIGNISTRSMAMSEMSGFDLTEGAQDGEDDPTDDFVTGRAKIEGGPGKLNLTFGDDEKI